MKLEYLYLEFGFIYLRYALLFANIGDWFITAQPLRPVMEAKSLPLYNLLL